MTAGVKDLTIEQGATFPLHLVYCDKFRNPIDLTGAQAHLQIRHLDGTLVIDLSTSNNKITLGGVLGTIDAAIEPAETISMNFNTAVYDLLLTMSNGLVIRLLMGKVTLSPGRTQ
jgi:hypothetical protein